MADPEQRAIAEILTAILGTSLEELVADRESARERLRDAIGAVLAATQRSGAGEPDLEPARAFARRVRSVLQAHAIDVPASLERLPDELWKLRDGRGNAALGSFLHRLGDWVSAPQRAPADADELIRWLEENLGPLIEVSPAQTYVLSGGAGVG